MVGRQRSRIHASGAFNPSVSALQKSNTSIFAYVYLHSLYESHLRWVLEHPVIYMTFALTSMLSFLYTSRWILFWAQRRSSASVKVQPMIPYILPVVGHALSLFLDPVGMLLHIRHSIGARTTHGLKVLGHNVYFIYGSDNVAQLRKYPTNPGVTTFVLKTLFGMSIHAVNMYDLDDSGIHAVPKPGSHVASNNRVDYLTHANFRKHLLGKGLSKIYQGFTISLMRRLPSLGVRDEWSEYPDLVDFWLPPMTSAMNEALAGPIIECINPRFAEDLLEYYPYLHSLLKGVP
ncbi:MAG: hypothetical protein Q9219_007064 [cf. Caloplaca sp. 3 TL-2023]